MKLGELVVELSTKGNTKELEKTLNQLKEAEKKVAAQLKLTRDLAKAETEEEKKLIKKNHAQKEEIASLEKVIKANKERNKTITDGIKGFTRFIGAVSLTIGVLDRLVNSSAKANQGILTLSQTSGIDVNTINKYASAAKSVNYNVTREQVAQTFDNIASKLRQQSIGQETGLMQGMALLTAKGGKPFTSYGMNATQFIENLREAIKGVDDEWVAEALMKMGISTDLIPMLRMSSSEFASVKNRFLSESQMKEEQKRSLELQEQRDSINKIRESLELKLYPLLTNYYKILENLLPVAEKLADLINMSLEGWNKIFELFDMLFNKDNKIDKESNLKPLSESDIEKIRNRAQNQTLENMLMPDYLSSIEYSPNSPFGTKNFNTNNSSNITINTTQLPSHVLNDSLKLRETQIAVQSPGH